MKKFTILTVAIFILSQNIFASGTLKVKKVKGQNALVEFPDSIVPDKDGEYTVSEGAGSTSKSDIEDEEDASKSYRTAKKANAPRDFAWSLGVSFTSLKTSVSTSGVAVAAGAAVTTITASTTFLFNLGIFEIGPLLSFTSATAAGVVSTSFKLGPDLEINFIKNKSPNRFIPGLGIDAGIMSTATGGVSSSGFFGDGGLYLKFFPFVNQTAIKLFAGFSLTSSTVTTVTTKISGPVIQFSFMSYF